MAPNLLVSATFTAGGAVAYRGTFDVAMIDPYPIGDCSAWDPAPEGRCGKPTDILPVLDAAVAAGIPLMYVGQAFGGAARRERGPTVAEQRLMVMLALMRGALGVQWYVRTPPNGSPYSPYVHCHPTSAVLTRLACTARASTLRRVCRRLLSGWTCRAAPCRAVPCDHAAPILMYPNAPRRAAPCCAVRPRNADPNVS